MKSSSGFYKISFWYWLIQALPTRILYSFMNKSFVLIKTSYFCCFMLALPTRILYSFMNSSLMWINGTLFSYLFPTFFANISYSFLCWTCLWLAPFYKQFIGGFWIMLLSFYWFGLHHINIFKWEFLVKRYHFQTRLSWDVIGPNRQLLGLGIGKKASMSPARLNKPVSFILLCYFVFFCKLQICLGG